MAKTDVEPLQYGHTRDGAHGIEGIEVIKPPSLRDMGLGHLTFIVPFVQLLQEHLAQQQVGRAGNDNEEEDDAQAWANWEAESDDDGSDSDDSGGWIAVDSDSGEIDVSDSDDEGGGPTGKKRKLSLDAIGEEEDGEGDDAAQDATEAAEEETEAAKALAAAQASFADLAQTRVSLPSCSLSYFIFTPF
jgi:hypothetical protein